MARQPVAREVHCDHVGATSCERGGQERERGRIVHPTVRGQNAARATFLGSPRQSGELQLRGEGEDAGLRGGRSRRKRGKNGRRRGGGGRSHDGHTTTGLARGLNERQKGRQPSSTRTCCCWCCWCCWCCGDAGGGTNGASCSSSAQKSHLRRGTNRQDRETPRQAHVTERENTVR